jgi:hypothetical protein
MLKLFIKLAVFALGAIFAFCLGIKLNFFASSSVKYTDTRAAVRKLNLPSEFDSPNKESIAKQEKRAMLTRVLDQEQRLNILKKALDEGSNESLELLRPEYLEEIPNYYETILPNLKLAALESFFKRFGDRDWKSWSEGMTSDPSLARIFVNDLLVINLDLGRFLDTSGHLLHGMYLSISNGEPYSIEEDLSYLVQNSSEVFKNQLEQGLSVESIFDSQILEDPIIMLSFERVEVELIKQFFKSRPESYAQKLALFAKLDSRAADHESSLMLAGLLRKISMEASMHFRANVFPIVVSSNSLENWAKIDSRVARALAEFYLVGSIDAAQVGRENLARKLLLKSLDASPEPVASQHAVRKFIEAGVDNQGSAFKQVVAKVSGKGKNKKETESPLWQLVKVIAWILLVGFALSGLIQWLVRRNSNVAQLVGIEGVGKSIETTSDTPMIDFDIEDQIEDIGYPRKLVAVK